MIERGLVAYHEHHACEVEVLVEAILRGALNDQPAESGPLAGQTRLDVVDGETVMVVDG